MTKLFIVGIPRDMEEIELVELFSIHGLVNIVTIVSDQTTGESKGYGFITMEDKAGAERAIAAFDQAEIDGRVVSVRFAEGKTQAATELGHPEIEGTAPAGQHPQLTTPRRKRPRLPNR
ncbi:RNA recognition motif domain-containing protein [Mucilaginibacter psychrotolerans]|uniref:RNA-binding protein n=1 Tax=Mucilaginibacter psychrotolerans TaxID=1524096 RepID=A0A4Y8S5P5_9SPHI|nr:RNA-binding protein [Mucilaginibacter psychrotolerans]TFF33961.1 RNA-binding protein [Mucilaginibacter psychrotolerans]